MRDVSSAIRDEAEENFFAPGICGSSVPRGEITKAPS